MWDFLSSTADILGIISFLIGIGTFITTLRIRKKMLLHVEKSDYIKEIDNQIQDLKSYYDTMRKDDELYNSSLLETIDAKLDDIQIAYDTILPKDLSNLIKKLRNHIKNNCQTSLTNKSAKTECAKQLHTIIAKLAKEKKVL